MYNLGLCYQNGTGTDICLKTAVQWHEKAAMLRNSNAMRAFMLQHCVGVEKNIPEARKWMTSAALYGNDAAYQCAEFCLASDETQRALVFFLKAEQRFRENKNSGTEWDTRINHGQLQQKQKSAVH